VRAGERAADEVRAGDVDAAEVGVPEIASLEPCAGERGTGERCAAQVAADEDRAAEVGAREVGVAEDDAIELRACPPRLGEACADEERKSIEAHFSVRCDGSAVEGRTWLGRRVSFERGPGLEMGHRASRLCVRMERGIERGHAANLSPFLRSSRLCQYGGSRAGARVGGSVGSPRRARNRTMERRSWIRETSFMVPLQLGHVSTSSAKVRFRSSAHGLYVEVFGRGSFSSCVSCSHPSLVRAGTMRARPASVASAPSRPNRSPLGLAQE
jgi:hypothetical protein